MRRNGHPDPNSRRRGRGGTGARRARKLWLLSSDSIFGGNGKSVPCFWCPKLVTYKTMHVDRFTPGAEGGTYARHNIVPACKDCNLRRGAKTAQSMKTRRAQ